MFAEDGTPLWEIVDDSNKKWGDYLLNRQQKRRLEREWKKIRLDRVCTDFIERNNLITIPYAITLQAVKISDDLAGVYHISVFGFRNGLGYLERLAIYQFANSLFNRVSLAEIGFIPEENFVAYEEI